MPRAKATQPFVVNLPPGLTERSLVILHERGTTLDDFVRLQLLRLTKNAKFFGLKDEMSFGKYHKEMIETVIRGDPEYIAWCLREVTGFGLTPEALGVLETTGVDL